MRERRGRELSNLFKFWVKMFLRVENQNRIPFKAGVNLSIRT